MKRDLLLLAKSKKYNGYCIACIDTATGEWVRVSKRGERCFPKNEFRYPDGREPELLDCIRFDVIEQANTELHPEDVIVDTRYIVQVEPQKDNTLSERVKRDYELHRFIYSNSYPKLLGNRFPNEIKKDPYSLMIVQPENLRVYLQGEKLLADFIWKETPYKRFRVTDMFLKSQMERDGITEKDFCNSYIVVSLGEAFSWEGSVTEEYYKLVAAVIEIDVVDESDPAIAEFEDEEANFDNDSSGKSFSEDPYEKAIETITCLARGLDPKTGIVLEENSVFNQPDVIRALFFASKALERIIADNENESDITSTIRAKRGRKKNFHMSDEEKGQVEISADYLPISSITRNINAALVNDRVKKLSYKSILTWLVDHGYIYEEQKEEQIVRRPTEKGNVFGIRLEKRISQTKGDYFVTLYSPEAQRFIVDHVNEFG